MGAVSGTWGGEVRRRHIYEKRKGEERDDHQEAPPGGRTRERKFRPKEGRKKREVRQNSEKEDNWARNLFENHPIVTKVSSSQGFKGKSPAEKK